MLPIGGSFDTFGAMDAWFRPLLDIDADGSAYLAIWASPRRMRLESQWQNSSKSSAKSGE